MITPEKLSDMKKLKGKPHPTGKGKASNLPINLIKQPMCCCLGCLLSQISLRNCLIVSFVGLVLVTSVPLWIIMAINTQIMVNDLSGNLCKSYMSDIMTSMNSYFVNLPTPSKIAASTIQQLILDGGSLDDAARIRDLTRDKILAYTDPCQGFLVGLENGYLAGWSRNVNHPGMIYWFHSDNYTKEYCKTMLPSCAHPDWQNMAMDYYLLNGTYLYTELVQREYDAKKRPWYMKAVAEKTFSLTDLYVFAGEATVGLSAIEPIWHPKNSSQLVGVTSIDVDMRTLSNSLSRLKVGKTGWIVLLDSSFTMVATSFPLHATVAPQDMDRLIDGEESIEPRVRMAARAIKDYGQNSFDKLQEKFAKNDNQLSIFWNFQSHRILFNVAEYYSMGLIPIIVVPESDFSFGIIVGFAITVVFLVVVLLLSVIFACLFSIVLAVPLVKIAKLMQKAKNMKLEELKPVWYVGILYEIRRIENAFFVMTARLKEYRAFLPQEILFELDKKNNKQANAGNEPTKGMKVSNSSLRKTTSMKDQEKSNKQVDGKQRSNSLATSNSEKSSMKRGQKLDALAIGLEFMEGYTVVGVHWDNYYEWAEILGPEGFIQMHSNYLRIVQDVAKRCHSIVDVTQKGFFLNFPSVSPKALSLAINAAEEIMDKAKFSGAQSTDIIQSKVIMTVCAESMLVGTIGTKDCRIKTHFGACLKLDKQCRKIAKKIGLNCVVCDNIHTSLKTTCDFRPCALVVINGLVHTLYSFDGKSNKQEDVEWMYKMAGEEKEKVKNNFSNGFDSLLRAEYEEAKKAFEEYLAVVNPDDVLAKYLLEKLQSFAENELDSDEVRKGMTTE